MKHDHASFVSPGPDVRQAYSGRHHCDQHIVEDRVRRFLPLVHKAAWHIYGAGREGMEVEDLVQTGLMALTDCARKHEGATEDGFAAYAKMRVRGAMFDVLRKSAPTSRGAMKRVAACEREKQAFRSLNGREPSLQELAALLDIDQAALLALEQENIHLGSLDMLYDDQSSAFAEQEPDPLQALTEQEDSETLARCITQLPERLQTVLQLYFVEELNLSEIAAILDVSIPRIHQLKASALDKMREMMA